MTDDELLALAKERVANDNGHRYTLGQINEMFTDESIPTMLEHAARRVRQAMVVILEDHEAKVAGLKSENAQLREALDRLRPLHHTPYFDEEHQGSNCVDLTMSLLTQWQTAEHMIRRIRDWCDKAEDDATRRMDALTIPAGALTLQTCAAQVRALLPGEAVEGAADGYADDRSSEPEAQTTVSGAQVSPVQTPVRADDSVPAEDCTMRACDCPCHVQGVAEDVDTDAVVEAGAKALMTGFGDEVHEVRITEPHVARQAARQVLRGCGVLT